MSADNNFDQKIGKRVRFHRLAAGVSVEELASGLEIASGQIEAWEAGRSRIPPSMLLDISKRIGINAALLFEVEELPKFDAQSDKIIDKTDLLRQEEGEKHKSEGKTDTS